MSNILQNESLCQKPLINVNGEKIENSNKKKANIPKIFLIFFSTLLLVGKNYAYALPQSLESHFLSGTFKLTNLEFNLLYSVYSFPNIILPFFGGVFIDKLGNRVALIIFIGLVTLGQFLFLMGTTFQSYFLLIFGRILFGLGSENLLIVQHTIIVKWVKKHELAVSIALQAAIAKAGAIINSPLSPALYDKYNGFFVPVFIGFLFCFLSFLAGFVVCYIDKKYDYLSEKYEKHNKKIEIKDLKQLESRFWLITFQSCLIFGAYTAFVSNENHIFSRLFLISSETAGLYLMIIYVISMIFPPFIGKWTDKYGKKTILALIINICFILCILITIFLPKDVNHGIMSIPLILHGIFLASFFPITWSCIPLIIEQRMLGTAYGVLTSFVNLNQSVSPIIFGLIEDRTNSNYFWALVFVNFQSILALFGSVLLIMVDSYKDGILDKIPNK